MFERFLHNHDVSDLAFSLLFRNLALSVVLIFGAIFLYDLGFSLPLIFGFYLTLYSVDLFMTFVSSLIASRIGYKHTILLAQVPLIAYVFWFSQLSGPTPLVFVIGVLAGLANALYWTSHHGIMASRADASHRASEAAHLDVMTKVAGVIGPIVGGIAIVSFGFEAVFIGASLLLIASALFLLRTPEIRTDEHLSIAHLTDGMRTRDFLGSIGFGMDMGVNAAVWPLLMYLTVLGTAGIGFVSGISFGAGLLVSVLMTIFADGRERLFLMISSILTLLSWGLRALLMRPVLFVSEPLYGATKPIMATAFLGKLYDQSQDRQLQTVVVRRMGMASGRILAVCLPVITGMLWPALIVAGVASLLPMLVAIE